MEGLKSYRASVELEQDHQQKPYKDPNQEAEVLFHLQIF